MSLSRPLSVAVCPPKQCSQGCTAVPGCAGLRQLNAYAPARQTVCYNLEQQAGVCQACTACSFQASSASLCTSAAHQRCRPRISATIIASLHLFFLVSTCCSPPTHHTKDVVMYMIRRYCYWSNELYRPARAQLYMQLHGSDAIGTLGTAPASTALVEVSDSCACEMPWSHNSICSSNPGFALTSAQPCRLPHTCYLL